MILDSCLLNNVVDVTTTTEELTVSTDGSSNVIYNLYAPGPIFSTIVITLALISIKFIIELLFCINISFFNLNIKIIYFYIFISI